MPAVAKSFIGVAGNEFPHAGVPGGRVAVCLIRSLRDVPTPNYLLQEARSLKGLAMCAVKGSPGNSLSAFILKGFQRFKGRGEFLLRCRHGYKS